MAGAIAVQLGAIRKLIGAKMAQLLNVIAYVLGAVGTTLMFFFSRTTIQSGPGPYVNPEYLTRLLREVAEQNAQLMQSQRIGFGLLTVSFLMQIVAMFVPPSWGT